jgi:primosomal protein N'
MTDPVDFQVLRVALPRPLPTLFDYLAPPGQPVDSDWIGCRVRVPFGSGVLVGVVAALGQLAADSHGLKCISERLDRQPLLTGEIWQSLGWAAGYYHEPLGQVLAAAIPATLRAGDPVPDTRVQGWRLTEAGLTARSRPRAARPPPAAVRGGWPICFPRQRWMRTRWIGNCPTGAPPPAIWPAANWPSGSPCRPPYRQRRTRANTN